MNMNNLIFLIKCIILPPLVDIIEEVELSGYLPNLALGLYLKLVDIILSYMVVVVFGIHQLLIHFHIKVTVLANLMIPFY